MHKSESFGSFAAGDIDKSAELSRAAHQISGNRALRIAELYKKREDLLKRKAELEDELRAAGINPDDVLEESDVNHYTRYGNENADIYPKSSEVANNSEESLAVEVHPGTVAKKAKKNRGFRKIIAGAIIGLTAMIGATAFGGFVLKKNQKNISQTNTAKTVNDVDVEIRAINDDEDIIEYAAASETNMSEPEDTSSKPQVIERNDDDLPSEESVTVANAAKTIVEQPTITPSSTTDIAHPTFVSPDLLSQGLDTTIPAPSEATGPTETPEEEYRYGSDQEKEENQEDDDWDDEDDWGDEDDWDDEEDDGNDGGEDDGSESVPESESEVPTVTPEVLPDPPLSEPPLPELPLPEPLPVPTIEQPIVDQPTVEQPAEEQPTIDQTVVAQPAPELIFEPAPELAVPEQILPEQIAPEQIAPELAVPEQIAEPAPAPTSNWGGKVLNSRNGRIQGPSGEETYYNLRMNRVVSNMHNMGFQGDYWVRDDGVKMFGNYVMVAANLNVHPRGSLVETSLGTGIVCDTGEFAASNPTQLDIATAW